MFLLIARTPGFYKKQDIFGLQDDEQKYRNRWKDTKKTLYIFFISGVGRSHHKAPPGECLVPYDLASPLTTAKTKNRIITRTGNGRTGEKPYATLNGDPGS